MLFQKPTLASWTVQFGAIESSSDMNLLFHFLRSCNRYMTILTISNRCFFRNSRSTGATKYSLRVVNSTVSYSFASTAPMFILLDPHSTYRPYLPFLQNHIVTILFAKVSSGRRTGFVHYLIQCIFTLRSLSRSCQP